MPQAPLVSELQEPFYIGHRGACRRFPEHSIDGYRACVQAGFPFEMDIRALSDGTLVPLHDDTVDRTMTGAAGLASSLTRAQWRAARIRPQVAGYRAPVPPTVGQVLNELGAQGIGFHEIKAPGPDAAKFYEMATARGLRKSIVVGSFDLAACEQAIAAGFTAMFARATELSAPDLAAAAATGIKFLSIEAAAASQTYMAAVRAAGVKPVVYTVTDPEQAAIYIGRGAAGIYTDDPWATSGRVAGRSVDTFTDDAGVWEGFITADGAVYNFVRRDPFGRGFLWNIAQATGLVAVKMPAWLWGPTQGTYRFRAQFQASALADADRWFGVWIGTIPGVQIPYRDFGHPTANGYHFLIRKNGVKAIYELVDGTATLIAQHASPAFAAAGAASADLDFQIEITADGITLRCLNDGSSVTATDTTHRVAKDFVSAGAHSTPVVLRAIGVSR